MCLEVGSLLVPFSYDTLGQAVTSFLSTWMEYLTHQVSQSDGVLFLKMAVINFFSIHNTSGGLRTRVHRSKSVLCVERIHTQLVMWWVCPHSACCVVGVSTLSLLCGGCVHTQLVMWWVCPHSACHVVGVSTLNLLCGGCVHIQVMVPVRGGFA